MKTEIKGVCVRDRQTDIEEITISRRNQSFKSGTHSGHWKTKVVPHSCVNPDYLSTMLRVAGHFKDACLTNGERYSGEDCISHSDI